MQKILQEFRFLIKENKFTLLFFSFFILTGATFLILTNKGDLVLFINRFATTSLDKFFIYYTELGNAFVAIPIAVLLLLYRYQYGIVAGISLSLSGLLSLLFKQVLFPNADRPTLILKQSSFIHIIENFNYHSNNSFPSGHTMTAFSIFLAIALLSKNKTISSILFILSMGVAFSRMYLLQHFFVDVYFGAILGVFNAIFAILIFNLFIANNTLLSKGILCKPQNLK